MNFSYLDSPYTTSQQSGTAGWVDGLKDLFFTSATGYIQNELTERYPPKNQNQGVIDTAQNEKNSATPDKTSEYIRYGLIAGGVVSVAALLILARKK